MPALERFATFPIFRLLVGVVFWSLLVPAGGAEADSLRFLGDLEYELRDNVTTDKVTGEETEQNATDFDQLYSLDIRKEIFPTLSLDTGGLFERESGRTEQGDVAVADTERTDTTIRPYIDLYLDTLLWDASAGYRKSILKSTSSSLPDEKTYIDEYDARLSWEPVELPRIDLDYLRTEVSNDPLTTEQQIEIYQLRSRYQYRNYHFRYEHTTTDQLARLTDAQSLSHSDRGTIRYSRGVGEGRGTLNSSLRGNRLEVEFSGSGDRRVDSSAPGTTIGTRDDDTPTTSDPEPGFSVTDVDLLIEQTQVAEQFSFGLDFSVPTEVDTLLVGFADLNGHASSEWTWRVFVRDSPTELWRELTPVTDETDIAGDRFEISFPRVETRFVKIVTRPIVGPGEDLFIRNLRAQVTLPPDTSEFVSTDWTADVSLDWRLSEATTVGGGLFYREEHTRPFDDSRRLYSGDARLAHAFSEVFSGRLRGERSVVDEEDEGTITSQRFSAGLTAAYLATFDQSLLYSFDHEDDENTGVATSHSLLLRNNFLLYPGWSLNLDGGRGWEASADRTDTTTTFLRAGSNLEPNNWLNVSVAYSIDWTRREDEETSRDQVGNLVIALVPTPALSLTGDWSYNKETGRQEVSTFDQRYFVNWAPLRDGTLDFSVAYADITEDEEEELWTLSPRLRWQVNPKTQLALEYNRGERETDLELIEFQTTRLTLRFFY